MCHTASSNWSMCPLVASEWRKSTGTNGTCTCLKSMKIPGAGIVNGLCMIERAEVLQHLGRLSDFCYRTTAIECVPLCPQWRAWEVSSCPTCSAGLQTCPQRWIFWQLQLSDRPVVLCWGKQNSLACSINCNNDKYDPFEFWTDTQWCKKNKRARGSLQKCFFLDCYSCTSEHVKQ